MDSRTRLEKWLWKYIGEPLYYCEECMKAVKVTDTEGVVTIEKPCGHTDSMVIAPRKAICSGKGFAGLSLSDKAKVKSQQLGATLTGRCV